MQKIVFGSKKEEAKKAVPSVFSSCRKSDKDEQRPKSYLITSLSDKVPVEDETRGGEDQIKPIPCQNLLPVDERKQEGNQAAEPLVLDPVRDGYDRWKENQRLLKEEDLGPKLSTRKETGSSNGGLLARAHQVTVADAVPGQYGRVPVDNFGMALLVGMGFDPTRAKDAVTAYQPKKRVYTKAGIGAEAEFKLPTEKG